MTTLTRHPNYRIVDCDGAEFISAEAIRICARELGLVPRYLAARDAAALTAESGETFSVERVRS